jgi:hypothetical protein
MIKQPLAIGHILGQWEMSRQPLRPVDFIAHEGVYSR